MLTSKLLTLTLSFCMAVTCVLSASPLPGLGQSPAPIEVAQTMNFTQTTSAITRPEVATLPIITVTVPYASLHNEFLFLTSNNTAYDTRHGYILDSNAKPVYVVRAPEGEIIMDFKVQRVNGKDYLSYFVGQQYLQGSGLGKFVVLDNTYKVIDEWQMGNGLLADFHDFQLLPNGNALMMAYQDLPRDMTAYGGKADAVVIDFIIQELNRQKQVVFEWRALDHIPLTDSYLPLTGQRVDFVHGNAVELDIDGNLLISLRSTNQILKINRSTGAVMWIFGGKRNQFNLGGDEGFTDQHDIRRLPNGNVSLWDNGDRRTPQHARAVEYRLDEVAKTATKVWEYRETPDFRSWHSGNFQRFVAGGGMISWGGNDRVTEVNAAKQKQFDATFPPGSGSYRAYRFAWKGQPAAAPDLVATSLEALTMQLAMSWNGATEVAQYQVIGARTPAQLQTQSAIVATVAKKDFETILTLTDLPADMCFFKVMPVDKAGVVLATSNMAFRASPTCDLSGLRKVYLPLVKAS